MSGPPRPSERQEPRRPPPTPSGAEYAGAGLQLALSIVAFMFAGLWLDKRLGTSPWLIIVGVFLGATAGFYSIYRKLMTAQRRADADRAAREGKR